MARRVDRLAAHLRRSPTEEVRLAGRVGGTLWLVAAVATLLLPAFPQVETDPWPVPLVWAATAALWGGAAIWLIDWPRVPSWVMPVSTIAAPIAVAYITDATGGQESPARLYLFLVLIFTSSFLTAAWTVPVVALCAVAWALPVAAEFGAGAALGELGLVAPMFLLVAGILSGGRNLLGAMHDAAEHRSEEQQALRRIATAVAAGESPEHVCDLSSEYAARLLGAETAAILRFEEHGTEATLLGAWSTEERFQPGGARMVIGPGTAAAIVHRTAEAHRISDTRLSDDPYAQILASRGFHDWMGVPVRVRGRVWGMLAVSARAVGALPADSADHLIDFAELIAMAVVNTEHVERLSTDAATDPLTGLANHRAFQERLRAELARRARHGGTLAVALVDIDRFKEVNDAGGHALGDEVLRSVSDHLRVHLRAEDLLARVGGDEFAVLLPESDAGAAAIALERARRDVETAAAGGGAPITLSVGVCDVAHARDAEALLRFADGALYWSKEHGRNRVSVYDPETIKELSAAERIGALQRSQALAGMRALARAIDARDPSTSEHSDRVAALAARMAEARGWPAERVALLHEAALVHDVGKIGLPDAILLKPSGLDGAEYEAVKPHAELGARMVEEILTPEQADWIHSHHERPDGCGYPRGLRGDALSEGAALLAVADAFDVMTSERRYAPARSVDDALAECRELVGRQFTAAAVAALEAASATAALA